MYMLTDQTPANAVRETWAISQVDDLHCAAIIRISDRAGRISARHQNRVRWGVPAVGALPPGSGPEPCWPALESTGSSQSGSRGS
jgi:hypothetical protein